MSEPNNTPQVPMRFLSVCSGKEALKKKLVKVVRLRQVVNGRLMKLNFYG